MGGPEVERVTIRSPTFMLAKSRKGVSSLLGWVIFLAFVVVMGFLGVAFIFVLLSDLAHFWKILIAAGLGSLVFVVMVGLFIVDILSSMEDRLFVSERKLDKLEGNVYTVYVTISKLAQKHTSTKQ